MARTKCQTIRLRKLNRDWCVRVHLKEEERKGKKRKGEERKGQNGHRRNIAARSLVTVLIDLCRIGAVSPSVADEP